MRFAAEEINTSRVSSPEAGGRWQRSPTETSRPPSVVDETQSTPVTGCGCANTNVAPPGLLRGSGHESHGLDEILRAQVLGSLPPNCSHPSDSPISCYFYSTPNGRRLAQDEAKVPGLNPAPTPRRQSTTIPPDGTWPPADSSF